MPTTRDRWRNRLPHWEVEDRPHFITIRCAGSLPPEARARVREIYEHLRRIEPSDPAFVRLQRQYFATTEKYLDRADSGFAPFRSPTVARLVLSHLACLETAHDWRICRAVVMPNHVHLLVRPLTNSPAPLRATVRQFKGATARAANLLLQRTGSFWQRDWFDRWMRTDTEEQRVADYIAQNPLKAGLTDWPWHLP